MTADDDHHQDHDHHHPALLRVTVRACPTDAAGLVLEVDVGHAVGQVTAFQVNEAIIHALAHITPGLDLGWEEERQALAAMRN